MGDKEALAILRDHVRKAEHMAPLLLLSLAVQGVAGKSVERGSQTFYVNGSQDFAVLLLTS